MGRVVGIDLGTTNSVVAVMEGGKPVVIANAEGTRTTPSVVAISKEGDRLVGQLARRQAVMDPKNTYYNVKRFIGRSYGELSPEERRVPYPLRRSEDGNVRIGAPRLEKEFAPEELSAMILRKLADEAGRYLGETVTGVVLTVPAYFNDSQRQATRDAGRIAGLDVKRILNEPTAASLAYGLDRRDNQTILVFDLGGGTFDVSLLRVGDGVFEVKATCGDTQLGGNDFDRQIVNWLADQFLEQEGIDLRRDRQALQRLTEAAEKAKIELSGVGVTEINLPFIYATDDGPKHLNTQLTRGEFESLCAELLDRLRGPVRQAIRDAGVSPRMIDEMVLVGGSTRMPMVQDLVFSLINKAPNQNVNPDEVVAVGAAIQAGIIAGDVRDVMLLDVTPLSLGLETIGGVMKQLIPRNTPVPVRRSDIFSTGENNQTLVEVHVLQGEREMAAGNKSLGRFKLTGIPPAPRGIPQIQVSFDIDSNGILQVSALDKTTGREQTVTIQGASTLSETEIDRMIQEAEEYSQSDRQKKARIEKRNNAESLATQAERKLREVAIDYGMYFASPERKEVESLAKELRKAVKDDDDRAIDLAQADLQDALTTLKREISLRLQDEDEDDFFQPLKDTVNSIRETIADTFSDGDDDRRDRFGRGGYDDNFGSAYGRSPYGGGSSYGNSGYGNSGYGGGSSYGNSGYGGGSSYGNAAGGSGGGSAFGGRANPNTSPNTGPKTSPNPSRDWDDDFDDDDFEDGGGRGGRDGQARGGRARGGDDRYGDDRPETGRAGQSGYGGDRYGSDPYASDRYGAAPKPSGSEPYGAGWGGTRRNEGYSGNPDRNPPAPRNSGEARDDRFGRGGSGGDRITGRSAAGDGEEEEDRWDSRSRSGEGRAPGGRAPEGRAFEGRSSESRGAEGRGSEGRAPGRGDGRPPVNRSARDDQSDREDLGGRGDWQAREGRGDREGRGGGDRSSNNRPPNNRAPEGSAPRRPPLPPVGEEWEGESRARSSASSPGDGRRPVGDAGGRGSDGRGDSRASDSRASDSRASDSRGARGNGRPAPSGPPPQGDRYGRPGFGAGDEDWDDEDELL